jgi:UDP-glucuronate 4-epimerase
MAVLVTGGAGFVGLNLVEQLLERGEEVVVFGREALPAAAGSALATLPGRLSVVQGDVRDQAALSALFQTHRIDRMLPLAVITAGPKRETEDTETVLDVNLRGMAMQLRAARDAGVGRIVFPSSISVYGESLNTHGLLREDTTPPIPNSIYGVTKYAGERMALRLKELWGLDLVCGRIGSVFGPWERDTGVRDLCGAPMQIAIAALKGEAAVLPARLLPRPWIYARDLARGLIALLDAKSTNYPVYNIGSGLDWAPHMLMWPTLLAEAFPEFSWSVSDKPQEVNIDFRDPKPRGIEDISRISQEFAFSPQFLPAAAFADYLDWLKRFPDYLDH